MVVTVAILVGIGAATVGGVFFAFSTFVLKALAELPPVSGIAAMQRINVVVLNPPFLGVFFGSALLSVLAVVVSLLSWGTPRSFLLLVSGLLYLGGCFMVTLAFNVPRNERLRRLSAESAEAASYWLQYVREWGFWNHVRTIASVASAACATGSLAS